MSGSIKSSIFNKDKNNKLTVNQNTDKLITNWSSFNIGKDATVQFVQPSSTSSALNRVTSSDPSYIFGTLQANGKIILINPNCRISVFFFFDDVNLIISL